MQRLLPPYLFAICILAMIGLDQLLPVKDVLNAPWRYIGLAVIAAGVAINLTSALMFRRLNTNIVTFLDPGSVVDTGPFAHTRNPMYLGFTLALLGVAVLLGSLMTLIPVVVFFIAADRWYIPFEERRLENIFGNEYQNYCDRVRRWI